MNKIWIFMGLFLICPGNVFAAYPDYKSDWMLSDGKGKNFYINGVNREKVLADEAVLYYGSGIKVPADEKVLLLENGISRGIVKNSSPLTKQQTAIAARWDALEYLRCHFPAGTPVSIIPAPPFPEFTISFPFDYYNSNEVENNKLWIFTADYKHDTNNIFRFQAAVSGDRVIARDGGYLSIPEDGLLMSGHGLGTGPSGSTRILNWVGIGCQVKLDTEKRSVTIITDSKTWYLRAEYWLKEAKNFIDRNRTLLSAGELKVAQGYWDIAGILYKNSTRQGGQLAWDQLKQSMDYARKAMIHASLSAKSKQLRYIAVPGEISEVLLETIKSAGFKGIMLHHDGAAQSDIDGLQRTALRANAMGLDVALWCWLPVRFPVPADVAKSLPVDKNRYGKPYFFELSSEVTRKAYLKELIEICRKLKVERVMLDFEAYRGGYGDTTARNMRKLYPELPADFSPLKMNSEQQKLWNKYQIGILKAMIDETLEELEKNSILSSLCVYPGARIDDITSGNCVSPGPGIWLDWLKDFDSVILMMYSHSSKWLAQRANVLFPVIRRNAPDTKIDAWLIYWPEICGYTNLVPLNNILEQSDIMLRMNVDGLSFFHSSNLDSQSMPEDNWIFTVMRDGIYRRVINPLQSE